MLPISSVASIQYQFPMCVLQQRVENWELAILSYWQHFLILPNLGRHLQNLVHGRGNVLVARDSPMHGQRGRCPSRVLQVSLGLIIYRLLIRASDRLLCILTFKSGHKRVTDCLISLFSTPDFGSEIGVLHAADRYIAKNRVFQH